MCLGDWGIETLSNRAARDLVSNLVNATSEFPLDIPERTLEGTHLLIDEDLVPGGVGIALNYPCGVMERETGCIQFTAVVTV